MRIQFGAKTIGRPQDPAIAVQQRIAGSFEGQIVGQFVNSESVHRKPPPEMRLLAFAFPVSKPTQDNLFAHHQSRGHRFAWFNRPDAVCSGEFVSTRQQATGHR